MIGIPGHRVPDRAGVANAQSALRKYGRLTISNYRLATDLVIVAGDTVLGGGEGAPVTLASGARIIVRGGSLTNVCTVGGGGIVDESSGGAVFSGCKVDGQAFP